MEELGGFAGFVRRLFAAPEPKPVEDLRPVESGPFYPRSFDEYVGQKELINLLRLEVESAKRARRSLSHLLFFGPAGVGKTALAHVLAAEMGAELWQSTGPEFPDQPSVFRTLDAITEIAVRKRKAVFWLIDEIDGMPRVSTYAIFTMMTHGYCTWQGQELYKGLPLSILGTTNYLANVPGALKSRFAEVMAIQYYPPDELAIIAQQSAIRMGFVLMLEAASFVGANAAGEPRRVNNRLLRVVRNLIDIDGGMADVSLVRRALRMSGLKPGGLSPLQFQVLEFLESLPKHRASLGTVAAGLMMGPKDVLLEVEPYLLHKRLIIICPGGRELTDSGTVYLEDARKEMQSWP